MFGTIKKVLDYFVWVMFFVLLILGGIIFVTERTYPGDNLYSFKLKFEDFVLATSKILNRQVDFSINLVAKRSNEIAKVLTPKNSKETLNRLDTQVELTANSIYQIKNPVEKKKAATKYIVKLNEVSSTLSEKQKEFVVTPARFTVTLQDNTPLQQGSTLPDNTPLQQAPTQQAQNNLTPSPPPTAPSEVVDVSEQIDNTQEIIEETIDGMNDIVNQPTMMQNEAPTLTNTPQPTITPGPTNTPEPTIRNLQNNPERNINNGANNHEPAITPQPTVQESNSIPTDVPQPNILPDNTAIPTEVPVSN